MSIAMLEQGCARLGHRRRLATRDIVHLMLAAAGLLRFMGGALNGFFWGLPGLQLTLRLCAAAGRDGQAATMAEIIGLSCRFPESNGPAEFWSNLMDGTDMVTCDDRRWPVGFQGLPPRSGKLPGFDKFDASFFSVHGKQAQVGQLASHNSRSAAGVAGQPAQHRVAPRPSTQRK